jgi:hypothetical protein
MNDRQELPPQAQPNGLSGNPPIPVGEPMVIKTLAPGEKEILEAAGWKEGEPVPENLAAIAEAAKADAANTAHLPPPIDLTTPPLQMPPEQKLEELSPVDQAKYRSIMQDALAETKDVVATQEELSRSQVSGAGEGVNEAINAALQPGQDVVIEDDTDSDTYAGTDVPKPNSDNKNKITLCPRCSWPIANEDPVAPTQQDIGDFLQSILGLKPFYKTYELFGGNLIVTIRSLTPSELDLCFRQLFTDTNLDRITTAMEEAERLARYRTCLQVQKVQGGEVNFEFPKTAEEWGLPTVDGETVLPNIWDKYSEQVNKSEIIHRTIMSVVGEFNQLVAKLEANSRNPDFWKAIGT